MRSGFSPLLFLMLWLLTCGAVGLGIDCLATRPAEIHVEAFRRPGFDDEQTLAAALQQAQAVRGPWWWFRSRPPVLVFAPDRAYAVDEALLGAFPQRGLRAATPVATVSAPPLPR